MGSGDGGCDGGGGDEKVEAGVLAEAAGDDGDGDVEGGAQGGVPHREAHVQGLVARRLAVIRR